MVLILNQFKLLLLLLFSPVLFAEEYIVDVGYYNIEHAWRGPDNVATYKPNMTSIGFTVVHDSGFAVRAAYGESEHTETTGKYSDLTLEMDYIISLELMYRYSIDNLTLLGGVGTYIIPASVRSEDHYNYDYDNDEGYFFGAEFDLDNDIAIGYRFTMHSRITSDPYDEWTKSHGIYLAYKW